jgi:hypothetical protein
MYGALLPAGNFALTASIYDIPFSRADEAIVSPLRELLAV